MINIIRISKADTLLYQENTMGIKYSGDASTYYQRLKYNMAEMILLHDDSQKDSYVRNLKNYIDNIDKSLENYEAGIINEEDRDIFQKVDTQWKNFRSHMERAIQFAQAGDYEKVQNVLLNEADSSGDALRDLLVQMVLFNEETAVERASQNEELAAASTIMMIVMIVVGLLLAVVLGGLIARVISKPIGKIVEAADRLAVGDIDVELDIHTKDEVGKLADSFRNLIESTRIQVQAVERIADGDLTVDVAVRSEKDLLGIKLSEMAQNLSNLIMNIVAAADQVTSGAKQISDSSMILSQGATEQASSVEQLSASIEEVSTQTKINAENANQANILADKAKNYAVTGDAYMKEMLKAMDEINQASANINKIIKVIDDIAFQTNILALNAAVEAARAGQHGKGFAVVADEVRTLAGKSAEAAKETTVMIEDSIRKAEGGIKIAQETADALTMIVEGVEAVSGLVNNINNASNEQAAAIAQINQGVTQVSHVVQENSATSEESEAASEQLSSQAEALKAMVDRFKVRKTAGAGAYFEENTAYNQEMVNTPAGKSGKNQEMFPERGMAQVALSDSSFDKY